MSLSVCVCLHVCDVLLTTCITISVYVYTCLHVLAWICMCVYICACVLMHWCRVNRHTFCHQEHIEAETASVRKTLDDIKEKVSEVGDCGLTSNIFQQTWCRSISEQYNLPNLPPLIWMWEEQTGVTVDSIFLAPG